ncbi:MAG: hypothetical protein FWE13_00315 [Firmicutes bacterium]|nr:hypothetical protein [Bacillota bacterium]
MVKRILTISEWIANRDKVKTECDFLITPNQGKHNLLIYRKNHESI